MISVFPGPNMSITRFRSPSLPPKPHSSDGLTAFSMKNGRNSGRGTIAATVLFPSITLLRIARDLNCVLQTRRPINYLPNQLGAPRGGELQINHRDNPPGMQRGVAQG